MKLNSINSINRCLIFQIHYEKLMIITYKNSFQKRKKEEKISIKSHPIYITEGRKNRKENEDTGHLNWNCISSSHIAYIQHSVFNTHLRYVSVSSLGIRLYLPFYSSFQCNHLALICSICNHVCHFRCVCVCMSVFALAMTVSRIDLQRWIFFFISNWPIWINVESNVRRKGMDWTMYTSIRRKRKINQLITAFKFLRILSVFPSFFLFLLFLWICALLPSFHSPGYSYCLIISSFWSKTTI